MKDIERHSVLGEFIRQVPRAQTALKRIETYDPERHAEWFAGYMPNLLNFFLDAFSRPILMPILRDQDACPDELKACFEYIEGLALNGNKDFRASVLLGILEPFLDGQEIVLKAYRNSLPATRVRIVPLTYAEMRPELAAIDRD